MPSTHDKRIEEVAHAARMRRPEERAAYLDTACGEDRALRLAVERLVYPFGAPELDAESSTSGTCAPTQPVCGASPPDLPRALQISSYRILGILGEGSMGVVYRAEQRKPHRVVALKVLKAGSASARALKRFEHEAEMLGRLQHPGIAQIFEAGTADTGYGPQPFLAMECLKGLPLHEYVRVHRPGMRDRLALMVKVCEGVQHAHQKGVIHRDLKPGNILVDESGQPKILDFGIALATDPDTQEEAASRDSPKQVAGTIPYMSLEQLKGDANELDTRTDVYALGVIAYQILSGRLPYDLQEVSAAEAVVIISAQEPTPLGTLDKACRGDLETIVSKALGGDKAQRYQSASDLAADIRRYLADQPILAHPPSAMYQFHKFARRHNALAGGLATALVALVLGVGGMWWGLLKAERQVKITDAALHFVKEDLLAAADPKRQGRDVTVREALDAASENVGERFEDEPLVLASIHLVLGNTYQSLGEYESAQPHLEAALQLRREELGEEGRDTLESINDLAVLYYKQRHYGKAEPLYLRALETRRRVLGEEHADTLESMNNLAVLRRAQGKYIEAEQLHRTALEGRRRVLCTDDPRTLTSMNNLARLLQDRGKLREAESLYRETLETRRRVLGKDHPNTLTSMQNLAVLLQEQGNLPEAEARYREVCESLRRKLGNTHPDTIYSILSLAAVLRDQHRLDEAEEQSAIALEWARGAGPGGQSAIATALIVRGQIRIRRRDVANAEPLLREALTIRREVLGDGDWRTASAENALGACLTSLGRLEEAKGLLLGSHSVIENRWGEAHERTQRGVKRIIALYEACGKPDKAGEYRRMLLRPTNTTEAAGQNRRRP